MSHCYRGAARHRLTNRLAREMKIPKYGARPAPYVVRVRSCAGCADTRVPVRVGASTLPVGGWGRSGRLCGPVRHGVRRRVPRRVVRGELGWGTSLYACTVRQSALMVMVMVTAV